MRLSRRQALAGLAAIPAAHALPARAEDGAVIDARVNIALDNLRRKVPASEDLKAQAKGILVMPDVFKGGFIIGGAYGEGALRINDGTGSYGATAGYYSVAAASVGFQAGLQQTSHALFFLTDEALAGFRATDGWEIGADAGVTFPDKGLNVGVDSTTYDAPIIGFVFSEDGLMLGVSLEGSKYSRITR